MRSNNRQNAAVRSSSGFDETEVQNWFDEDEEEREQGQEPALQASSESIAEKYARSQLRVVRETKDYTLDYLKYALQESAYIINVAPEFQRRQRWSQKKQSQLIESFLMNIPIPPVFLFERDYNAYEVIDGQQRLAAIRDFLSNNLALTGLEYWQELNNQRFNQLPLVLQRGLMRRSLSAVILLAESRRPEEDDFDVRRVLFDRLNSGGEKLNPQELRNALYPGPFNQMLKDIARSDEFTAVWGIPPRIPEEEEKIPEELARNTLYKTMADCELVLRFFAIRETLVQDRHGSLRKLLDSCMHRHGSDTAATVVQLATLYMRCLRQMREIFEGTPFRLPQSNRPSRPLYDALMVALSLTPDRYNAANKHDVQARLDEALQNEAQYDVLVGRGNTVESIRQRVALATTILDGEHA